MPKVSWSSLWPADPLRFGEPVEQAAPERPCEVVALWQGLV
jgi:hypothetical protein